MDQIQTKWKIDFPVMIPSLKRYTAHKKTNMMMIEKCLDDFFDYHVCDNVHVLAQEYTVDEMSQLEDKYPNVDFEWHDKRLGIVGTFNKLKDWGCSLGEYYLHKDDDTITKQMFDDNPTLLAMEYVMKNNINRVGAVTVPSISIHHFSKGAEEYIKVHSNPCQLVLINSKAAKECTYDKEFENFRSDTDFTMQMASKKYLPIMLTRYFSFMHTVPMSAIEYSESGGRKFRLMDNVGETKGSLGGDRRIEMKKKEYDAFNAKWPKVITFKNYKQQVLKRSIQHLSEYTDQEVENISENFDYSLINNYHPEYYGTETPETKRGLKLFGKFATV